MIFIPVQESLLYSSTDDAIYPITTSTAVYMADGTTIDSEIKNKSAKHIASLVTLKASNWNKTNKSYSLSMNGVTIANTIFISLHDPVIQASKQALYKISAIGQSKNNIQFSCKIVPTEDIALDIVILGS